MKNTKDIALVLSSGGPRGFAYIGAIEEMLSRGYNITSVCGTSIGSLIGGMYAAGKLDEVKTWLYSLDSWKVFTLMDIKVSMNSFVKGDKIISALKEIVPPANIEELNIPYKAIATDFYTGEEVIFDSGDLYEAIRASISIPSMLEPVKYGYRTLIDGGIANAMPLNRIDRNGHDILVGINVNHIDVDKVRQIMVHDADIKAEKEAADKSLSRETREVIDSVRNNDNLSFMDKVKLAGMQGQKVFRHAFESGEKQDELFNEESNYYNLLSRTFNLMNHVNSRMSIEMTPPDILVNLCFDDFGEISDYAKAEEISEKGRNKMKEALDIYEQGETNEL